MEEFKRYPDATLSSWLEYQVWRNGAREVSVAQARTAQEVPVVDGAGNEHGAAPECVGALCSHGADIKLGDNPGFTPLLKMISRGNIRE